MTPERAKEVTRQQSQFPHWGNYSRFMTEDEIGHVQQLFHDDPSGNVSFASIVARIANS